MEYGAAYCNLVEMGFSSLLSFRMFGLYINNFLNHLSIINKNGNFILYELICIVSYRCFNNSVAVLVLFIAVSDKLQFYVISKRCFVMYFAYL